MNNWINNIDKIVYINLDYRIDRNVQMLNEFKRVGITSNKFVRLSATKNDKNGAIGCTLSHIRCLQMAIDNNWDSVLIFEDDFTFIDDTNYINKSLNYLFDEFSKKNEWSIICLARGARQEIDSINDNYISKALAVGTASGYIIKKDFYSTLLNNFKQGLNNLMRGIDVDNNTLDGKWIELQKDNKWYIFSPSLGYQRASFSDIEKRDVEYLRFDKTIKFNEKYYLSGNIMGGLGNQMFIIAAICSLAWHNNLEPIFEKIGVSPPLSNPRPVYWKTVFNKVAIMNSNDYNKIQFNNYSLPNNNLVPINLVHNKSYRFTGYFQNPNFFNKYKSKIIELFSLDTNSQNIVNNIYNSIVNNNYDTISIHVRRSDYIKLQNIHVVQNIEYYKNAIDYIKNKYNNLLFLIFSDDINWCKTNFGSLNINCIYVENVSPYLDKDILDMYLMAQCKHNIIANSTFSWWGAYMNKNKDKIVCAPNRWFIDDNMNNDAMNILDNDMILI